MNTELDNQKTVQHDPFSYEIENVIHATNTQIEIWSDCLIGNDDANKAYNISFSIKLKGKLFVEILEKAINDLVLRHESLRATFSPDGVYMNIYKDLKIAISHVTIEPHCSIDSEKQIEDIITEEVNDHFNLVHGPLFKIKLIKKLDLEHILIVTYHHIIGDGLSNSIIVEDLGLLYSAYIENKQPILKKAALFSAYANKVNSFLKTDAYRKTENFWQETYKKSVPVIELPLDYPRPQLRTYKSKQLNFPVTVNLINSLRDLGTNAGCSLTTTILASFEIFLQQLTRQNDLVVGFPVSGNRQYDMNHLIGDCANLLPLRSKIENNSCFNSYLEKRKGQLLDAYAHNQLSFGHLLKSLAIARDPARIPLVPVALSVDLNRDIEKEFSFYGLTHEFKTNPKKHLSFEIKLHACFYNGFPTFQWSYNTALFKEESITQIMTSFEALLNKLIASPNCKFDELFKGNYIEDYKALNDTEKAYPNVALCELLSQQAEETPNNIALEYNGKHISYQDLHIKVNQFAHFLEANGVTPGDYIAVSYPRSPELVYAILAIIQCGAAYLPLDHEYPSKRVEFMMNDSEAKFLLTSSALSTSLPKCSNTILIDDAMESLHRYPETKLKTYVNPENIIYLLYTSGSTGKPKGAKISNKNLVNLLCALENEPGVSASDRIPFISTISFDIASFELFFPLIKGGTLILPSHETSADGRLLYEMLEKEKISLLVATPTTYQMLIDSGWSKKLPLKILCCGEPLPIKLAKELIKRSDELWNLYGPTEVTIFSSCKHIKTEETLISVGPPIANMQYYIVDQNLNLLPPNTIGEIVIGGDGVGKGYLGRPDLTASKFIPNIFSNKKDDIMYLSGDLGKLLPTNEIVCQGRIDHQIKVRGHRIEIGEIENTLMAINGIESAIVLANSETISAYVTVNREITNEMDQIRLWRNELASQLPTFMVPHIFYILDKMPTTLNNKIDRVALLAYEPKVDHHQAYTAPRTNEERIVTAIWQEYLKIDQIDIFSNFFEMGGHSIMAINIMIKIEKETGVRIPLSALFQHSTIEKFAQLLQSENQISTDYLVPIKPSGTQPPLFIIHGAGLNILNFVHIVDHFDPDQPIYGFQGIGPNGFENWFQSIEEMAARYIKSVLEINPKGPYALAGFSFGGIVAFEMAKQLKEQGKTVSIIAMLDTYVHSSYYYGPYWQKKLIRYYDRTYRRIDFLKQMLTSWESLKLRLNSKNEYLVKKYFVKNKNISEQEAIALEKFNEANFMVDKIIDRYQLIPQELEVELFRAENDESYKLDAIHLGWKKAALKGVNIYNITGNHLNIVSPPNDKVLAEMLQDLLYKKNAIS